MSRFLILMPALLAWGLSAPMAVAYLDAVVVDRGCDTRRIDASPEMQRALRAVRAKNRGQKPILVSCYRSQATQDSILRRYGCAPRYGSRNCAGQVANQSLHTYGVAVDMRLAGTGSEVCHILDGVRNEVLGGVGGVGGYGGDLGHLELRSNGLRTAWNVCGRIRGMRGRGQGVYSRPSGVSDYMRERDQIRAARDWDLKALNDPRHPNYRFMREFLNRGRER